MRFFRLTPDFLVKAEVERPFVGLALDSGGSVALLGAVVGSMFTGCED